MALVETVEIEMLRTRTSGMSPFLEFLNVANRAAREATPDQRIQLRAVTAQHLEATTATERIKKVMGW